MPSKLDSSPRLAKITAIAYGASNPALDRVVQDAARLTRSPIAIVTLVAKNIQHLRASVGLPRDLEVSRATSRCDSFCQFVVETGSAFLVRDSWTDNRVPKKLVEVYGIRAYAGVPLYVDREVVGSLCVIDTEPRDFDGGVVHLLSSLAATVSHALEAEWRERLVSGVENPARVTMEAAALTRLDEARAAGDLSPELADRGRSVLGELENAIAATAVQLPPPLRAAVDECLAAIPAEKRSFALAHMALKTDFARLLRDPSQASLLEERVRSALATLRYDG